MADKIIPVSRTAGGASKLEAQMAEAKRNALAISAEQVACESEMSSYADNATFTPSLMMNRFREFDERLKKTEVRKDRKEETDESQIVRIEAVEQSEETFTDRNPELDEKALFSLRNSISENDDADSILKKVLDSYPDQYLADEALGILTKNAPQNTPIGRNMFEARMQLNALYEREIKAGRNISEEARTFSKEGLGSPTALRDLYREITGSPKHPADQFEALTQRFKFDDLSKVLKFIFHSLGADIKSKGPSIERLVLESLYSSTRTMQAILGVFRFFNSRMSLIMNEFARSDLEMPPRLNFEQLAKQFVKMIQERYPAVDKILKLGAVLGIADEDIAQIIIYTQYRDAIRQVSPFLFKSEKHRQDLLLALLDALSEIEDQMDEEEEEEE
jgi:type III secretion protein W